MFCLLLDCCRLFDFKFIKILYLSLEDSRMVKEFIMFKCSYVINKVDCIVFCLDFDSVIFEDY